jgi:hypothetical protein
MFGGGCLRIGCSLIGREVTLVAKILVYGGTLILELFAAVGQGFCLRSNEVTS